MDRTLRWLLVLLLAGGGARADERLGLFEFFARGSGAYCYAAGPIVTALQEELAGRAVLLEYDYDAFSTGRVDRWWAGFSGPAPVYLPLVMVGSGLSVCQGPVDYGSRYREMLEAELARPPGAVVRAWSLRVGDGLRVWVRATNLTEAEITPAQAASLWVIAWEDSTFGLTRTWVRGTASKMLGEPLPPGGTVTTTVDVPTLAGADWQHLHALVLLEHRPAGGVRYDLLQAALAPAPGLSVSPSSLVLSATRPTAELLVDGPHVLTCSARADVPWLHVEPAIRTVPGKVTVGLVGSPPAGAAGTVRLDAAGEGLAFSASVAVAVEGPAPEPWAAVLPAAAHAPGALGTFWRTDVAAVNDGPRASRVTLTFVPVEGPPATRTTTLGAGETVAWTDVLSTLFGLEPEASGSGTVRIEADQPLALASRTFMGSEAGTFGGFLPAVTAGDGLAPGRAGILPHLTRGPLFRTNVGVANLGPSAVAVTLRLRGGAGERLGAPLSLAVPPWGLVQVVDVFGEAGAGDQDVAFAEVDVTTSGGLVWAYASVIDNRTGDPTIVPVEVPVEAEGVSGSASPHARTVPAAAHAPGANGSLWRTDVAVVNPSGTAVSIEAAFTPAGGGAPVARTFVLAPGVRFEPDVLCSLFGLDPGSPASGAIRLVPDGPVTVSSRTFNETGAGTFGAHLRGVGDSGAVTPGRPGTIPLLEKGTSVRTNVGLANVGEEVVTVVLRLSAADGTPLGHEHVVAVPAGALVQVDDVFAACGSGDAPIAWARVEVLTPGGRVQAYASVIDNGTGDPTIVPVSVR